jgi:hypothetical protein
MMSDDELDGSDEDEDNVLAPDDSVLTKQPLQLMLKKLLLVKHYWNLLIFFQTVHRSMFIISP